MQHEGRADVINSHQHVSDPYNPPPAETKALSTGSAEHSLLGSLLLLVFSH